jgi:hypothetical protein
MAHAKVYMESNDALGYELDSASWAEFNLGGQSISIQQYVGFKQHWDSKNKNSSIVTLCLLSLFVTHFSMISTSQFYSP